jgi:hypothetical protein
MKIFTLHGHFLYFFCSFCSYFTPLTPIFISSCPLSSFSFNLTLLSLSSFHIFYLTRFGWTYPPFKNISELPPPSPRKKVRNKCLKKRERKRKQDSLESEKRKSDRKRKAVSEKCTCVRSYIYIACSLKDRRYGIFMKNENLQTKIRCRPHAYL